MKTAEIKTAQNVTIRYDLASLRDRGFALFMDLVILWFGGSLLFALFSLAGSLLGGFMVYVMNAISIVMFTCYTLIFEILMDGQTPGKKMMGLKVIKLTGKEATAGDFTVRWIFRLIDIWWSFTAIGAMMIGTTPNAQRIGDILSDTIVVRLKPRTNVELDQLLRMHEETTESIEFERVTSYSEEDMLMAMSVLDRSRKYPTKVNRDILMELAHKMKKDLDAEKSHYSNEKFIRKAIRDYVTLTR